MGQAAEKAQAAYQAGGPYNVDAAALSLHGFYSGTERLFEWIARQIDSSLPQGVAWHRELLQQMTLNVPDVRPPVIQPATPTKKNNYQLPTTNQLLLDTPGNAVLGTFGGGKRPCNP